MCGVVEVWASKYGRGRAVAVSFCLTSFFVLYLDTSLERDLIGNFRLSTWQEFIGYYDIKVIRGKINCINNL